MPSIIFVIGAVFNIILNPVVSALSCKDESGLNVPTWTIMKLPRGADYYYYDTNNGFNFSPNSINDTDVGALAETMAQLWDFNTQYMIYNDEAPQQAVYNFSVAHSKAIWMWDDYSAVLITHSVPKFPEGPKEQPSYRGLLDNAWEYGQVLTCIPVSLSALPTAFSMIRNTNPLIYEQACDSCYKSATKPINQSTIPCATYIIDGNYVMFMKPSTAQVDIWASCIAPYFSSQVSVESWIHGTTDNAYCPPDYPFATLDIQSLQFPEGQSFTEYDDHSKWGILQNPLVCFGDLNRVIDQMERAGTVYCWKDYVLWKQLNGLIVSTNSC